MNSKLAHDVEQCEEKQETIDFVRHTTDSFVGVRVSMLFRAVLERGRPGFDALLFALASSWVCCPITREGSQPADACTREYRLAHDVEQYVHNWEKRLLPTIATR
jgi:hypothetical protein